MDHLLLLLLTVAIVLSLVSSQTMPTKSPGSTPRCFTCASIELYDKWWSTSLPTQLPDALFDDRCDGRSMLLSWAANDPPRGLMMQCNTACVTMIIQLPEVDNIAKDLYVRGCLSYLLGDNDVQIDTDTCSSGSITRFQPWSVSIPSDAFLDYCSKDLCNKKNKGDSCVDPNEKQGEYTDVECISCQIWGEWDQCTPGDTCNGKWCYKKVGYIGDTYVDMRGCSPINPYANQESACYDVGAFTNIMMWSWVAVDYSGTQCYCNDNDDCNTSTYVTCSSCFIFIMVVVPFLRYFV